MPKELVISAIPQAISSFMLFTLRCLSAPSRDRSSMSTGLLLLGGAANGPALSFIR